MVKLCYGCVDSVKHPHRVGRFWNGFWTGTRTIDKHGGAVDVYVRPVWKFVKVLLSTFSHLLWIIASNNLLVLHVYRLLNSRVIRMRSLSLSLSLYICAYVQHHKWLRTVPAASSKHHLKIPNVFTERGVVPIMVRDVQPSVKLQTIVCHSLLIGLLRCCSKPELDCVRAPLPLIR